MSTRGMSDASFEVGYPRRRWTETHLEIGHHDDAPAGVRVPALASPAHRVDGGRAPALVSQTLGRRSGMRVAYIRGASERGLRLRYRAEPRLWRFRARFRVWKLPTAFVGPRTRTRRRSTLDPALTAQRRHCARPGGRDEHRQKQKWLRDQKSTPNANEKMS
jgi:hypothetical protein